MIKVAALGWSNKYELTTTMGLSKVGLGSIVFLFALPEIKRTDDEYDRIGGIGGGDWMKDNDNEDELAQILLEQMPRITRVYILDVYTRRRKRTIFREKIK